MGYPGQPRRDNTTATARDCDDHDNTNYDDYDDHSHVHPTTTMTTTTAMTTTRRNARHKAVHRHTTAVTRIDTSTRWRRGRKRWRRGHTCASLEYEYWSKDSDEYSWLTSTRTGEYEKLPESPHAPVASPRLGHEMQQGVFGIHYLVPAKVLVTTDVLGGPDGSKRAKGQRVFKLSEGHGPG
ncbi:hypothetical protein EDB89DRAFT_1910694 [Lactarius sanguifluus]|nr:hypothetical protein EDB89DRAFT_1910694 [Lactarius sanguifluus]